MRIAQSSHINAHQYDPEARVLQIEFVNGAVYQYSGVDANTYHTFAQSSSPGTYFHNKIKPAFAGALVSPGLPPKRKR